MAAELYIASVYANLGYNVLWPSLTQSRYDFVLERDGAFHRVQAKKATPNKNGLQCRITTCNKNCEEKYGNSIDVIAITDGERVWSFEFQKVSNLCVLTLESYRNKRQGRSKVYDVGAALIHPRKVII